MRILLIRKRHLALGGVLAVFLSVFAGLLWQGNAAFTDAFSAQEQPRVTVVVDHGNELFSIWISPCGRRTCCALWGCPRF